MPALTVVLRFGVPVYAIAYTDNGRPYQPRKDSRETAVEITENQASLGVQTLAALYEMGRLT